MQVATVTVRLGGGEPGADDELSSGLEPGGETPPTSIDPRGNRGRETVGPAGRPVLLVLSSAVLFAASFPPLRLWPLAWLALAPLVVTVRRASPPRAAALGGLWTFAAAVGVAWWLPGTTARSLEVSLLAGLAAFVLLAVVLPALPVMAFAAGLSWLGEERGRSPLLVATGWTAVELLWARLPFAGWPLLAASQVPALPVVQIAELTGPFGVAFVLAAVNGWLALLVAGAGGGRLVRAALGVAPLVAATVAFGLVRLAEVPLREGDALRVAAVQPAASPADTLRLTRLAAAEGARLAVWPEHALDAEPPAQAAEGSLLREASRGIDLVVGAPSTAWLAAGPRPRNSVFLVRDGRLAGRSDKRSLLPLAERGYLAGTALRTLRTQRVRVGALVCGEALLPGPARAQAAGGAELLAVAASDRWLAAGGPSEQTVAHAALRAIENRRWVVRATAGGVSAVIDPYGRIASRVPAGAAGVAVATAHPGRVVTAYQRWGDGPAWCAVALACLVAARRGFRRTAESV